MRVLYIALYDLKKALRDKVSLFFIIFLPIVFIFVIGSIYGSFSGGDSRIPVGIKNNSGGEISKLIIEEMKQSNAIKVIEMDEQEIIDKVKSLNIEVGFIFPPDFDSLVKEGTNPDVKMLKLPSSTSYMTIGQILNSAYTKINIKDITKNYIGEKIKSVESDRKDEFKKTYQQKVDQYFEKPNLISVEVTRIDSKEDFAYDGKAQSSVGYTIMFLMFTAIFGAGEIFEEKKQNTWTRLNASPLSKNSILAGKLLGTFIKIWFQIIILVGFGHFVLGIDWGNSILVTVVLFSFYILSITMLGVFLSSIVTSNSQLGAYGSVLIICSSMLAGCYWPIEIMPAVMQKIAIIFPQYWAVESLTAVVMGNISNELIQKTIFALLIITGVLFILNRMVLSFQVYRRRIKRVLSKAQ